MSIIHKSLFYSIYSNALSHFHLALYPLYPLYPIYPLYPLIGTQVYKVNYLRNLSAARQLFATAINLELSGQSIDGSAYYTGGIAPTVAYILTSTEITCIEYFNFSLIEMIRSFKGLGGIGSIDALKWWW